MEVNAHLFLFKGKPTVIAMARDISDRKKMEKEILKHRDNLELLVKERTLKLQGANAKLNKQIQKRKQVELALKKSSEQLRQLSHHLETALEKERSWVAREIHDELGQTLTALKMDVTWLEENLGGSRDSLLKKTNDMTIALRETIRQVQRISQRLRPSILDNFGICAALAWQADEFQKRSGILCKLSINADEDIIAQEIKNAFFRVSQEALTNIMRYAQATVVSIALKELKHDISLVIKDNGIGITEDQISNPRSFGLIGMRERIRSLHGVVKMSGKRNDGTQISVRIPIKKKERINVKDAHSG